MNERDLRELLREHIIKELSLLARAEDMAMDVHSGQKRKGTGLPYYIHPYRVYQRAKQLKMSKDHQLVALLHDVYEDAKNRQKVLAKIKSMFGNKITSLVVLLSHDKGIDYKEYLLKLAKTSKIAFDVKMLDMVDNLLDRPKEKQKMKYKDAVLYLIQNNIDINPKIKKILFNLANVS